MKKLNKEDGPVVLSGLSVEEIKERLECDLPKLEEQVRALEEARRLPREVLDLVITI